MVTAKFINSGGAKMDLIYLFCRRMAFTDSRLVILANFAERSAQPSPHSLTMAQPQSCEKTTVAKAMTRKSSIKRRVVM